MNRKSFGGIFRHQSVIERHISKLYFLNIIFVGDKNDSFDCNRRVSIKHSSRNVFDLRCNSSQESITYTDRELTGYIGSAYQYIPSIRFFLFVSNGLIGIPKQCQDAAAQHHLLLETQVKSGGCSIGFDSWNLTNC